MTATFKTEREFLTAIVNGGFKPEFVEFAKGRIAALDKKNADRKVSKSALAHKAENDNIKGAILAALVADKFTVTADIAAAVGVSTQKVSALARQLVESGDIVVTDVPIKGKGKVKGSALKPLDSVKDAPAETSAE